MNPLIAGASATILWGFTYVITTTLLPQNPIFIAAVRAIVGGLPLLFFVRELPSKQWWIRLLVLGTLNFGLFFGLLFVAAVRLPGGVAATVQALGPLFIVVLAWPLLGAIPARAKLVAVGIGAIGVSMVVLKSNAALDSIGVMAALGSALAVALGSLLVHKWGRPHSIAGFTALQLLVGGAELGVLATLLGDVPAELTVSNMVGFAVLSLIVTALAFLLWFKAIEAVGPTKVAPFLLLTPITAFVLDAVFYGYVPGAIQLCGVVLVLFSLVYSQHVDRKGFKVASHHKQKGTV